MPARMWRHWIHSFLEVLKHGLPYSLEHMLTFICTAYSITTLLYETVPQFEDNWIECLGDLCRYRMAIRTNDQWTVFPNSNAESASLKKLAARDEAGIFRCNASRIATVGQRRRC